MRIAIRIGGSLLIILGVLAVAVAVAGMKFVGRDNTIMMDPASISTDGVAISSSPGLLSVYDTTLHVHATADDPKAKLWVGIAHQDDLDNYLGRTGRAEVTSFRYPSTLGVHSSGTGSRSVTAPTRLDWWVAKATGTGSVDLAWPMQDGSYGAVIMNQSGKPKVAADVSFGLQITGVYETAELVGLGGLVAVLLGVTSFVLTRRRAAAPAPAADHGGNDHGGNDHGGIDQAGGL